VTPEGKVKAAVDEVLKQAKAYKHKPVMNGMGAPALDYNVCHRGFYAAIETKAKDKPPTPRQLRTMREIIAAGGTVFLIDDTDGADINQLRGWLVQPFPKFISILASEWLAKRKDNATCDD
jgi:hypothetical protein